MNSTIFGYLYPKYTINKPIRLIELFAGIGSQAKALTRIGANFEHYKVVEFDKYAIASYNAIHNTNFPTLDITKIKAEDLEIVDVDKYEYIMTYSFPCQDLSLAGVGKGMTKGESTRSGLLWEVERILDECLDLNGNLPQCLLMENVPMIHSKKHVKDFKLWIQKLESLGYKNYIHDLNAKNYGIPQNRDRCFMVSVLGDYSYDFRAYIKLEKCLGDLLEDEVEEKYFLSDKMIEFFMENSKKQKEKGNGLKLKPLDKEKDLIAKTITTRNGSRMDDNYIIKKNIKLFSDDKRLKKIIDNTNFENGKVLNLDLYNQRTNEKLSQCLTDGKHNTQRLFDGERIRKFTPKECWRLMGFDDEDFEKASKVNSNAQLYKQAGNSIVVNVLETIFKEMMEG